MSISYRTRRRLKRLGTAALFLLLAGVLTWLCWVIWLERYIVYTRDGATIDFSLSDIHNSGEIAMPPVADEDLEIHYNEGENAVNTSTDLAQLSGYYITYTMLSQDMDNVVAKVKTLPTNTPVMIDMKGGYGSFYYSSDLAESVISQSVNVFEVEELLDLMNSKNLYLIARIPAFQDYNYALNHVSSGIPFTGGGGALWTDNEGYYWLKPSDNSTLSWLSTIILELRGRGFDEVVLDKFWVPDGQRVIYNGDKEADLLAVANALITSCTTNSFTVSFTVSSSTFPLPEGRCRMYLTNVSAKDVELYAAQSGLENPEIRLVFIADTNDTRYSTYGVLRSLNLVDETAA